MSVKIPCNSHVDRLSEEDGETHHTRGKVGTLLMFVQNGVAICGVVYVPIPAYKSVSKESQDRTRSLRQT